MDLSLECGCQPCTVNRVVWSGISRGSGDDVMGEGDDGDANEVGEVRPWCENTGRLPGVEVLNGSQRFADKGQITDVKRCSQ